ncbi:hypothetical protein V6N13_110922 [Hibiscus sabdariffa]
MVTTRNRAGNPPPPPARPPAIYGSSHRRFTATPIIDIPSSSESGQNAARDPPLSNIRLDRRAPRSPSFLHPSSFDFSILPRDSAGPSRPRPRDSSPSYTFYSMPTMSHSQSMPDAYSAHSYVHEQADNPEILSFQIHHHNRALNRPVHHVLGILLRHLLLRVSMERMPMMITLMAIITLGVVEGVLFAVPSDEVLQGYLDFDNEDAVRFRSIRHRRFQVCKYIPDHTLDSLHLRDAVMHYFDAIGWRDYAEIRYSTYYELVFEFYSTFTFLPNRIASNYTPGVVSFRLLGQLFEQSFADFNYSMGFVTDVTDQSFLTSLREIPVDFDADAAYATLTHLPTATYNAKSTKGWHIHDLALRYIHWFLAYNYSGRNDSSTVLTKVELFFLWCMHSGLKVNLGFWFAPAFERVVRTDRPLILGPYITRLASRLFPLTFNTNEFTFAFTMDPLDARCLDSMSLLADTPSAPHLVPPGTTTPCDGRVFL